MAITACTLLNLSAFVCFLKLFYVNFVNYSVYRWNSASVPAGGKCSCCLGDIGVGGCQPASWYYPKKGRKMSWFCVLRNLKFRVMHLHIFVWELELKLFGFFFSSNCLLLSHSDCFLLCPWHVYNHRYSVNLKMSGWDWRAWCASSPLHTVVTGLVILSLLGSEFHVYQ